VKSIHSHTEFDSSFENDESVFLEVEFNKRKQYNEERRLLEIRWNHKYKIELGNGNCYHCDDVATVLDHIPALATLDKMGGQWPRELVKVPSCQRCNDTLQDFDHLTEQEKRRYLAEQYTKKRNALDKKIQGLRRLNDWFKR